MFCISEVLAKYRWLSTEHEVVIAYPSVDAKLQVRAVDRCGLGYGRCVPVNYAHVARPILDLCGIDRNDDRIDLRVYVDGSYDPALRVEAIGCRSAKMRDQIVEPIVLESLLMYLAIMLTLLPAIRNAEHAAGWLDLAAMLTKNYGITRKDQP